MKKIISAVAIITVVLSFTACGQKELPETNVIFRADVSAQYPDANRLQLNGDTAVLNGTALKDYDYTWSFDPSMSEPRYAGEEPDTDECYIAHDIVYYPEIDEEAFT